MCRRRPSQLEIDELKWRFLPPLPHVLMAKSALEINGTSAFFVSYNVNVHCFSLRLWFFKLFNISLNISQNSIYFVVYFGENTMEIRIGSTRANFSSYIQIGHPYLKHTFVIKG